MSTYIYKLGTYFEMLSRTKMMGMVFVRRIRHPDYYGIMGNILVRLSSTSQSQAMTKNPVINFTDPKLSYRSKKTWEVVRSLLVLTFCKYEYLVDRSNKAISLGRKLLGKELFNKFMKATFYGQFVAGENEREVQALIERLKKYGPSIILNYAVEDDEQESEQKSSGIMLHTSKEDPGEKNLQSFMKTIDTVASATSGAGFTAIKVTALTRPETLMVLTEAIKNSRRFTNAILDRDEHLPIIGSDVTKAQLHAKIKEKGHAVDVPSFQRWLANVEFRDDRMVDSINWSKALNKRCTLDDVCFLPLSSEQVSITDAARESFFRLADRLDKIAEHAHARKMRVLVDAEQSYFQLAIARFSLELMRKYNKDLTSIYNTYQCYLKDAYLNMMPDLEISRRESFRFGAKVVRGAYMTLERDRALSLGYPDPINPDFDSTSRMYEKVVGTILKDISERPNAANIVIAGHNEGTVRWAVNKLQEYGIPKSSQNIHFGQLLGMSDQLSFTLANAGYNVVKCVPYGSCEEVLPYLVRRAQENRGFMEKTTKERFLLRKEIVRRIRSGEVFHDPDSGDLSPIIRTTT